MVHEKPAKPNTHSQNARRERDKKKVFVMNIHQH